MSAEKASAPADMANSDDEEEQEVDMAAAEADNWDDWEGDDEEEPTKSLFGPEMLSTPELAIEHDASAHGFDIRRYAVQEGLDDYGIFRCINYIRSEVAAGRDPLPELKSAGSAAKSAWIKSDEYLKPAVQEDPLLLIDYEEYLNSQPSGGGPSGTTSAPSRGADAELERLRAENAALMDALSELRAICMPAEMVEELIQADSGAPSTSMAASDAPPKAAANPPSSAQPSALNDAAKEVDGAYFDSYSGFGIHKEMISDKPRTEAYQKALELNPSLVKGSCVMDVGCGTGILSLFAARGGAARVVSVDGSKRIAEFARKICKLNGYSSDDGGPMTVVHGKIEEIHDMPVDQVDILVSEWMGYALLFETMLDTVLYSRDKYLRPGGAVLPDIATIHIAGASQGANDSTWWKEVYGFNMTPIGDEMHKDAMKEANVLVVKEDYIVTESMMIKELDLCTMKSEDQDFSVEFSLQRPLASSGTVEVHAIVLWFDTAFSKRFCSECPVLLSTSPKVTPTHWAQTLLVLREPVPLGAPDGGPSTSACASCLTGRLSMVRNRKKHRSLDISLEYKAELSDGRSINHTSLYAMNVLSGTPEGAPSGRS